MRSDQVRDQLLDALAGLEFDRRYYALCESDVGEPVETPATAGQEAGLRAAGFDCRYDRHEDFFACTRPGALLAVNVIVRYSTVELVLVLDTPAGLAAPTAHGAASILSQRAGRPERRPPYPRIPFGTRRPYEATVAEVGTLISDIGTALAP